MGDRTAIEWTHHTFNPWWGCVEVSPGCDHCYARTDATRYGHAVWGKDGPRRFFGDAHWNEPFKWHRRAEKAGVRERVFCASMADVLEERHDVVGRQLDDARQRLWVTILNTPSLDWLILTKRPDAGPRLIPTEVQLQPNFWFGTTLESQDYAWRVDKLARVGAAVRFLSVEPLLGPVDLRPWLAELSWPATRRDVQWVIVGGESGPGARPCDVAWVRSILSQCREAMVPAFCKQLGRRPWLTGLMTEGELKTWPSTNVLPAEDATGEIHGFELALRDRKGGDWTEWPEDLRVREFPV